MKIIVFGFFFLEKTFYVPTFGASDLDVPDLGTPGLDTSSLLNTLKSKPPIKRYTFFKHFVQRALGEKELFSSSCVNDSKVLQVGE